MMLHRLYGKTGDIIYCLPALKWLADCAKQAIDVIIHPIEFDGDEYEDHFTLEKLLAVIPLLQQQPQIGRICIEKQEFPCPKTVFDWRKWFENRRDYAHNLAESAIVGLHSYFPQFELDLGYVQRPWLILDASPPATGHTLTAWNNRYPAADPKGSWSEALSGIDSIDGFLGFPDELSGFTNLTGSSPELVQPLTYLESAHHIAASEKVICSQSAPLALATALGKPVRVVVSKKFHDSIFDRPNATHFGVDEEIIKRYALHWPPEKN